MVGWHRGAGAALDAPSAQRRSMRMRRLTRWLVPVDLPVDGIVVLEREERAGEAQRIERAPCEGGGSR